MGKQSNGITDHSPSLDGGGKATQKKQFDIFENGGGANPLEKRIDKTIDRETQGQIDIYKPSPAQKRQALTGMLEIWENALKGKEGGFNIKEVSKVYLEDSKDASRPFSERVSKKYMSEWLDAVGTRTTIVDNKALNHFKQVPINKLINPIPKREDGGEERDLETEMFFENEQERDIETDHDLYDHEYAGGGSIYEVNRLGEEDRPLTESMMSAKNLTQLKEKVQEKYGTTKGFRVEKRDKSGRMVSVKFDEGGSVRSEVLGAFNKGELRNEQGELVTDKNEAYNMIYLADLRSNPAKYAYDDGGGLTDKEADKFERILKNSAKVLSDMYPSFPEHIMFGGKKIYLTYVYNEDEDRHWDDNAQSNIDNFKKHGLSSTVKHFENLHGLYQEINPQFGFGGAIVGTLIGGAIGYSIGKRVGYGRAFQGYAGGGEVTVKSNSLVYRTVDNRHETIGFINQSKKQVNLSPFASEQAQIKGDEWAKENGYQLKRTFARGGEVAKDLSVSETEKIAYETAKALGSEFKVRPNDISVASFELDYNDIEWDGGSYLIFANGDVMNVALPETPVYYNYKTKKVTLFKGGGEIKYIKHLVRSSKTNKFLHLTPKGHTQWLKKEDGAKEFNSIKDAVEYIKENLDASNDDYKYDVFSTYKDDDGFLQWHYHYINQYSKGGSTYADGGGEMDNVEAVIIKENDRFYLINVFDIDDSMSFETLDKAVSTAKKNDYRGVIISDKDVKIDSKEVDKLEKVIWKETFLPFGAKSDSDKKRSRLIATLDLKTQKVLANKKDGSTYADGGELKYGAFEFEQQKDGLITVTKPDRYESLYVSVPPTKEDYENVVNDYFQLDSRDMVNYPLDEDEIKLINDTFSKSDRERVLGVSDDEMKGSTYAEGGEVKNYAVIIKVYDPVDGGTEYKEYSIGARSEEKAKRQAKFLLEEENDDLEIRSVTAHETEPDTYAEGGEIKDIRGNVLGYIVEESKTKGYSKDNSYGMKNNQVLRLLEKDGMYAVQTGKSIHEWTVEKNARKDFENAQKGEEVLLYYSKGGSTYAEGGEIKEASAKWSKVMGEFKDGTLHHGTTGDVVTDRDMAMAIAYSEAREIYPKYGDKFDGGGKIEKDVNMFIDNSEIERMLKSFGADRLRYSQAQLQELSSYSYPLRLSNDLVNKLWGLAMEHGFGGYKGKKILAFNVGNGDILRYITEDVSSVDAVEPNKYLNKITDILFGSNKISVHTGVRDNSMGKKEGTYDLSIGVAGVASEVGSYNHTQVKSGSLYIVVAPSTFMDNDAFEKERNQLNDRFDLQVAYRLPDDIMPNFDVIVLKKK